MVKNPIVLILVIAFVVMCTYMPEICCWRLTKVGIVQKVGHAVASTAAWGGSTLYHLLMPHKSGEKTYKRLLFFDVFCIWLALVSGTANPLYVATHCYDQPLRFTVMSAYLVLNGLFLIRATRAKTAWDRATSFIFLLVCRWGLYYVRAHHYVGGHKDTSSYMIQHVNRTRITMQSRIHLSLYLFHRMCCQA